MHAIIIKALYIVFMIYFAMAIFICVRDLLITKKSKLWIPLIAILIGVIMLLFATSALPAIALPIAFLISAPIFLTDKRRNWDAIDQIFRWVSLVAFIGAAFITINYFFLR